MVDTVGILVEETSITTGTGNLTLVSKNARRSFNESYGTGGTDKFFYFIMNRSADEWEHGTGHLLSSTVLVRDTVLQSSNADALVNFSAGTKDIVSDRPADLPLVVGNIQLPSEIFTSPADYTAGTSQTITLIATPVNEDELIIFFAGVHQHSDQYSLSGNIITFTDIIPSEVLRIDVRILQGGGVLTEKFTSSDQVITAAGQLILPHSLSDTPAMVTILLICQTDELGYTAGDIVCLQDTGHGTAINVGISIIMDATNLTIRFASDAKTFNIINASTGAGTEITNVNWKIRFIAMT